ncbi:hypothetical protein FE257_009462 [Aspergillus nanangensis]|uniref:FAD-binding domain-containing protein n=1 Tax=Aspergillus nanangensis TaxID=2582783 RepID=A0AAD4CK14_ASPNN|nr:hypothetical protein FE257_009462 [Aspergillus nanangensis]
MTDSEGRLRVIIVGAGIAGLSTSIAITRVSGLQNVDIQLFEQATRLEEIGASIALSPNVELSHFNTSKHTKWGPRDNFFASRLGKNQYTTVGAYEDTRSADEVEKSISWNDTGDVHYLQERFKYWNPVVKALTEFTPSTRLFPNFAGHPLSTWVLGSRVTLVGDAAHTHGGAFAAGGSLALDDAFALALSLKHVFAASPSGPEGFTERKIEKALHIYDAVRRPHAARLQDIVQGLMRKKSPSFTTPEEEDAALVFRMNNRPSTVWLTEHDVERAFQQVIGSTGVWTEDDGPKE